MIKISITNKNTGNEIRSFYINGVENAINKLNDFKETKRCSYCDEYIDEDDDYCDETCAEAHEQQELEAIVGDRKLT